MSDFKNKRNAEVFRGSFRDCLKHFAKCLKEYTSHEMELCKPIACFCRVSNKTAKRWIKDFSCVSGERALRLMCYLAELGYYVFELEMLENEEKSAVELIGYSVMSAKELSSALGYSRRDDQNSISLLRIINSHGQLPEEKRIRLREILGVKEEELARKKKGAEVLCWLGIPPKQADQRKILVKVDTIEKVRTKLKSRLLKKSLKKLPFSVKETIFELVFCFEETPLQWIQMPNEFSAQQRKVLLLFHDALRELGGELAHQLCEEEHEARRKAAKAKA